MFLEQSPQARRVPLVAQSAGAERREDAQVSNPAVAYQVEDAAGLRDEFLTFAQELPISGRRGLVRDSADAAASAAGLAAKRGLLASASALRASFYEVLYRERVAALLQEGTARLARTVEILARREREGEGSGYELRRAEQERADLAITGAEAGAALAVARSRFGSFFDPQRHLESARLAGDLAPAGAVPETEGAIEQAVSMREDLRALQEHARRLDLERQAARRRRWPEPTVTAGWKRVEAPGVADTGFVAAAALQLPIFDRGQVVAARAGADRERVELEAEILEREIRADVQAALAREREAREAAAQHGEDLEQRAIELRTIAEIAYDEGETGILELLDAYRSSLAAELRALGLLYEAKRAAIERDLAIGAEVTP
jgi:cobalt-zinc-cadmium efflux system outer membrane protein